MKNKPQVKKADEKSDYKKELDQLGNSSNFDKENTNLLKQMYVGAKNKPVQKKTAGTVELPVNEVDNPPVIAFDPNFPDEITVGFEDDKKFGVDESEMETQGLDKAKEEYKTRTNPAGTKDTAPRATETPFEVSAKNKARQSAREAQARIANAKNLTELMFRKSLIKQNQMPTVAKTVAQLDNKSFGLVKNIVDQFSVNTQGRSATASAKTEKGLQTPIHLAKPMPKGSQFNSAMEDAPWEGTPPKGYNHREHTNGY